jgi:hypothetical protein
MACLAEWRRPISRLVVFVFTFWFWSSRASELLSILTEKAKGLVGVTEKDKGSVRLITMGIGAGTGSMTRPENPICVYVYVKGRRKLVSWSSVGAAIIKNYAAHTYIATGGA